MQELLKTYDSQAAERRWYHFWMERGYFGAPVERGRPRFCITIPPPNVTGELHMGHALQHAIHDLVIRRKRMQGFNTLCLPGTDHASIGTSVKIEDALRREGLSRWDLGREPYLARAWEWTHTYGGRILEQLKALGCSYDWSRTRFTLDEGYYRAVMTAFVRCYDRGWIFRGKRVMNWCTTCQTVVSDLEVKHQDLNASLWHIRYHRADADGSVTVATTRPETMLGDTALAVRPGDARYADLVGRRFTLPLVGREIPLVADHHVDPQFGTGVVKVTPAHDPNDFEIGRRHDLPAVEVIGPDGRMTPAAGPFAGMDRFEARERIVTLLSEQGHLEQVEPYAHAVGHHDRCGSVLEPLLSEQWFMKMDELAQLALTELRDGRVQFTPDRFAPMAKEWLENIRDWCISRQLWWGQRIPVYRCAGCGAELASVERPAGCARCGSREITQDPDVLDTWFSSALWPFATLGWPDATPELDYFYPADLMITGRDILYLWVTRMMMMGEQFINDEPFRRVMIHATVMTAEGKRMSKSLGTGVDPLELVTLYGADATRFALTSLVTETQDIRFKIEWREGGSAAASDADTVARAEQCETARNFCTKLWNISRFALLSLGENPPFKSLAELRDAPLELADRWILSRYAAAAEAVNDALDRCALGEASWLLYHFVWDDLADWYVELVKPRLREPGAGVDARAPLLAVLEATLRLAHPFLPFLTEEVWQALPGTGESIMVAPYPGAVPELRDDNAERRLATVIEIARAVRNLRAELQVPPRDEVEVMAAPGDLSDEQRRYIEQAARARILAAEPSPPTAFVEAAGRWVMLSISPELAETALARLRKEQGEVERNLSRLQERLANPQFLSRAPQAEVDKQRALADELRERLAGLERRIASLGGDAAP